MNNSNNDVKPAKALNYARAAQGSSSSTPAAGSPQLNGKTSQVLTEADVNSNGVAPEDEKSSETSKPNQSAPPTHSSRSSISSAAGSQPAWVNKGPGVHMPPRANSNPFNNNPSTPVQFGNFANPANTPAQKSPTMTKATPVASGGTAPPSAIQGKDVPQFGSIPSNNNALVDGRAPAHSRTNSNASDFRPSTMSPNPQSFPAGYPVAGNQPPFYQQGQFAPAMPNMRGRGGYGQYQARGGARNVQGPRNATSSPISNPQQQHAAMGSPMGSPAMFNYGMQPQMYGYGGGFPQQHGFNPNQNYPQQYGAPMYANQGGRNPLYNQQHQYQNPNLQAPAASSMSRSGSAISERPASAVNAGTPAPSTPAPASTPSAFQTPSRKKGSSAIKIVNPNSKEEVVLPKTPAPVETRREAAPSPAPKIERPASSGPSRPSSSSAQAPIETAEQKNAKREAAKQAILDRIATARAADQGEADKKAAEVEKAAKAEADKAAEAKAAEEAEAAAVAAREEEAKKQAAKEAEEAAEKARAAAQAAALEESKAREAKEAEAAAQKAAEEKQKADDEMKLRAEQDAKAKAEAEVAAEAAAEDAQKKADADAKVQAKIETESTQDTQTAKSESVTAPTSDESAGLNTIAETASTGQVADVVETKAIDGGDVEAAPKEDVDDASSQGKRPSLAPETSAAPEKSLPSAMTTSLISSKRISDISLVSYPSGINSPDAAINKNTKEGKIKYDKDFLLQFQKVFTDKPNFDWDERIKSTMGDSESKGGKGGMGGRSASNRGNASPFGGLPSFNTKPLKSSEERFKQAEKMRAQGIDPAAGLAGPSFERGGAFKPNTSRKDSLNTNSPRTDSKRGGKTGRAPSNRPEKAQIGAPTIAPEDVKPLANSGNRWTPKRAAEAEPLPGVESTNMAPEIVQRKVKGLLNKLTLDNFDRITDQILEIASQSKDEDDGRTLRQVIALTFEKATDEAHFSNMYARFCRKMMEFTSDEVKDEGITDKHGNPVVGGALFRKYLLSRCQEDFERGWKTELPPKPDGEPQNDEAAMLSDEYYIAAAAKRRGLGLVRFIGELFLLQMLNEKIMNECIRKLLANVVNPEEEEIESVSKLVETVGSALDSTPRGQDVMTVYIQRMQMLMNCDSLSSRIKFMVLDVIDLRKAGWVGSKTDKGPKTIQEIHDEAAKAAALKESQRGGSHRGGMGGGPRPDFGRGDARNMSRRQESHGPTLTTTADGWSTLKASARDVPARAGDLQKFGKFSEKRNSSRQETFGPGGNLSSSARTSSAQISRNPSHSAGQSREDSRTSQTPNAFALLGGDAAEQHVEEPETAAESDSARPRLNLLPRGATDGTEAVTEPSVAAEAPAAEDEEKPSTAGADESEDIPMPGDE